MKKLVILVASIIFVYSCSQKSTSITTSNAKPVETIVKTIEPKALINESTQLSKEKVSEAVKPTATASVSSAVTIATTDKKESGQVVLGGETYRAKCGQCHDLKEPILYNEAKWIKVVGWMAPRARLDASEIDNVIAYLSFNAKKL